MQNFERKYPKAADARFHTELGMVRLDMGNAAEAIKQLENALKLDNTYAPAQYALACTYAQQNQWENALAWLETAFKSGRISRDQVKADEDRHLRGLKDNKDYRRKYESLKKSYLK
jgi:Tfp pilus assembly protein PilF